MRIDRMENDMGVKERCWEVQGDAACIFLSLVTVGEGEEAKLL